MNVKRSDSVELALAADLQRSVLAHMATSSCTKYKVAGGVYRPECGDEKVRPQRKEHERNPLSGTMLSALRWLTGYGSKVIANWLW